MPRTIAVFSPARSRRLAARAGWATMLILSLAAGRPAATQRSDEQGQPTFRAGIDVVEVDVTVNDRQGRFVRDLTKDDFEILEDGRPQEVSTFELIDLPYHPRLSPMGRPARPAEPDVRTNIAAAQGRVFILVLDDLHIDALRSTQARQAARLFIEQYVGPGDLVAVVHTSGRANAGQEFTQDHTLVLASVDKLLGRKTKSSTLARLESYEVKHGLQLETAADIRLQYEPDPLDNERGRQAEATAEVLQRLAEQLVGARGHRKSVVLISEGIDYDTMPVAAQTTSGLSTFVSAHAETVARRIKLAIETLTRANIAVYGIDPRGLVTSGSGVIEMSALPENPHLGLEATAFDDELRRARDSLRVLSEETGGIAAISSNDLSGAFDRLMRDNSTYYMLGYYPADSRIDGRFRRIEVRVRRPGVSIRARKGYLARPSTVMAVGEGGLKNQQPADVLRRIVNEPLPVNGLPLRAYAAPFKGPRGRGSVLVTLEVDAGDFRFGRKGPLYTNRVDAAAVGIDARGKVYESDQQTVNLELKPATHDAVLTHGLRFLVRLDLPPGRYQLRAAAVEAGSGAAGTVALDTIVPAFDEDPLSMSGVVLTSTTAPLVPTPRPDADLSAWLPAPSSTSRTFAQDETIAAAFALYHNAKKRIGTVDVTTTVVDEAGQARFSSARTASEDELRGAPDGYGYVEQVPLGGWTPGRYVLRVRATSRGLPDAVIAREIPFVVEDGTDVKR